MKKVELHLHLDGSIDESYSSKLVGRDVHDEVVSTNSKSLTEYLEKFKLPIELLQDLNNIETFCYLLGKELEKDEVIYAEVRFCPLFHIKKYKIEEVIDSIIKGFTKLSKVKVNLIFCMMRHFSFEENKKIIQISKKYLKKGVVGLDLAGDESDFKTKNFKNLFEIVKKENIPFTIHAGEADDYTSVLSAIEFGAKRIGHGINSIQSDEVINLLKENSITLEICPTSNVNTNVVENIKKHPIKNLVQKGVLVTINTDNRTVSNTTLNKEYEILKENFGFNNNDFLQFNLNAVNCAFISDNEKEKLKKQLKEDYL